MPDFATLIAGRWWAVLLRGVVTIAFGAAAFFWSGVTAATLVPLFGFYALADGVVSVISAIGGRRHGEDGWLLALEGMIGLWAGVVTLRAPEITAVTLVFFISIWAMATGFLRIAAAMRLRQEIAGELWLALSGLLSVLLALMLVLRPDVGAIELVWVIAGYALVLGLVEIMLGVELWSARSPAPPLRACKPNSREGRLHKPTDFPQLERR
jgi:uncharacterized membrane protein HdeD (DUF308 family)